jgi:hypothetical protein
MNNENRWSVRDVITTVLMSVLLIAIQLIVNMVCMVNDLSAWCCRSESRCFCAVPSTSF